MYNPYPQNLNFSPARSISSPHLIRFSSDFDSCSQYFGELLAERQNLRPFIQVLPLCSILLDQEILKAYGRIPSHGFGDYNIMHHGIPSPVSSLDVMPDLGVIALNSRNGNRWDDIQQEIIGPLHGMHVGWQSAPGSSNSFTVKRIMRLDIPVERYPNFNFVGRLLGPRGNSLKRIEASTSCRIFIRGKGSIKDPDKEESLRGKPGYEHLSEPLHIFIETDLPANIVDVKLKQAKDIIEELLKPVDESHDTYKRQQLRELAMLNNIREERPIPQPRGSVSPFNSTSIKCSKFGW